jgi:hypothetical protein
MLVKEGKYDPVSTVAPDFRHCILKSDWSRCRHGQLTSIVGLLARHSEDHATQATQLSFNATDIRHFVDSTVDA